MSRKKKNNKVKKSISKNHSQSKTFNWLKLGKRLMITAVLAGIATFSLAAYMDKLEVEQDLSVIGNGTATVVQIHDPGCQLCQQLKRNLDSVKGDFKEDIQFKIANIKSKKGSDFARKHQVRHVTLVLFDKRGRRVNTIEGVTPPDDINDALNRLARR